MDMSGSYEIPAPRETVWDALNDVEVLKACIPGCETITKHSDTELEATVSAKVGPVKAKFSGAVTLSDMDPPNGYTISGQGKGGAAGFAKGGATVKLEDSGVGTTLSYEVNASVGGKLAQIGGRLIDSTAKKMADQFFSKFSEQAASMASAAAPAAAIGDDKTQAADMEMTAKVSVTSSVGDSQESGLQPVSEPAPTQKPDALNDFTPISFEIWLAMVGGVFALSALLFIFG